MRLLSAAYARVAGLRRQAYERRPERRRRLQSPVISVGNLALGGSGKTPVVEAIARLLADAGERPAIVSRGYGRRPSTDGALVISDRERLRVGEARRSGDEPQMLARRLPGVPVVVASDRYLGGRLAETQLGATCILLDDGFQHLQLARDVDLVIVSPADLDDRVVPGGRLREPITTAACADAVIVPGDDEAVERVRAATGAPRAFRLRGWLEDLRAVAPYAGAVPASDSRAVVAVAGIARPGRFVDALTAAGWDVRRQVTYRDHHWFTAADVARAEAAAREAGAARIVTTEKDAVRLEPLVAGASVPWTYAPMRVTVEPDAAFRQWLFERLGRATP
ncbi:MAG: tetraacyldisaccharide 4'-kinase [Vicinamibacterales bacterium]